MNRVDEQDIGRVLRLLAADPVIPTGLAATVRARFQRRRRRRSLTAAVSALSVGLVTLAAGGLAILGPAAPGPPPTPVRTGPLQFVARADRQHVYVVTNLCGSDPSGAPGSVPGGLCYRLFGSSDGGATWSYRSDLPVPMLRVLGPLTLLRTAFPDPRRSDVSTDGGATWAPVIDGPPIDAVAPGDHVVGTRDHDLLVYDPAHRQLRALTGAPLVSTYRNLSTDDSATVWLTGADPATGRPAVAVSHDAGRQWTVQLLPGAPPLTGDIGSSDQGNTTAKLSEVHSRDGRTGYVMLYDPTAPPPAQPVAQVHGGCPSGATPGSVIACGSRMRAFVTHDGGTTWAGLGATALPTYTRAWVTADKRLVLAINPTWRAGDPTQTFDTYVTTTDGAHYTTQRPPGLPAGPEFVDGYVASTDSAVYISDDGWNWHKVWPYQQ